ncbi:MAG: ABC transporter permease [Lentilactobacillus buchneri]|nr:ABC transporter permease [Lentilactobacillus buchneri]MCI2019013.1 ABC transporter permease [Lentilactobacillus buchneri]
MNFSLYQEFYKFNHKKVTWLMPFLLLFLMLFMGFTYPSQYGNLMAMTSYNASDWILMILVIVGSTLFSMEFQNNTILTLLYKSPNKFYVYFSKFVVIMTYDVILHIIAIIFTAILILTPIDKPVSWLAIYKYQQPLVVNMFATTGIDLIESVLIISLVFLMSCLINSNSLVIAVNIGIIIFGPYATTPLIRNHSILGGLVKWNPLNMTNLTTQYYNYGSYHPVTLLNNMQLAFGTITYIIIFFSLGYLIFRKKRF